FFSNFYLQKKMSNLNKDVLYSIFEELQYDRKSLYSCLLVNKTWCVSVAPTLWKNPWKDLNKIRMKSLLNVIISHLPNETIENLKSQGIDLLEYQKPLFDYIRFCRHLNLFNLEKVVFTLKKTEKVEKSKILIVRNVILNLLINENARFTHLYIPPRFNLQIHLIPGSERCFSELKFLQC